MSTRQPNALRLARKFEEVGFMGDHRFAKDHWCRQAAAELRHQHARIAELEEQLSAVGAGGVEALRKQAAPAHPAEGVPVQVVQPSDALIEAVDAWFADNTGLGGCSDKDVAELAAIFATQPEAQGLELANCKGGKWLTVVYRDIQPGDEARAIAEHPKVSALSWSHALHDRDAALAAQAKHGEAQQ